MSALSDFLENLAQNRTAPGNQPVVCDVEMFIAAMNEISGVVTPTATPASPVTGGRLTLTTGVPVLSADVTAATSTFFALYNGASTMINSNGTGVFVSTPHGELTQTLADATKSPAAAAANSLYDMFVWNDAGTIRCTRGLAWTNATTRAAALARVSGIVVNNVAVANGPAAQQGTYVGTIATDAAVQLNMMFAPAGALGGTANRLDVWNMYNRVLTSAVNFDSTGTWAYDAVQWRAKNGNANNSITFVTGFAEDMIEALNIGNATVSATTTLGHVSIALDSTAARNTNAANTQGTSAAGAFANYVSSLKMQAPLGQHFLCPIEQGFNGAGTVDWRGTDTTGGFDIIANFQISLPM